MVKLKFNNLSPKTKKELELIFASSNTDQIARGLVCLSLYGKEWKWAQDICLQFLGHNNPNISGLAATCLGHIARIHHVLDEEKVRYALESKIKNHSISGRVQDALDDINYYLN